MKLFWANQKYNKNIRDLMAGELTFVIKTRGRMTLKLRNTAPKYFNLCAHVDGDLKVRTETESKTIRV